MEKKQLSLPALFMLTAIALGALGAHALKSQLSADKLASFETGVRYQVYGSIGLFIQLFAGHLFGLPLLLSRRLIIWGIILFSGSIYGLVLLPLCGLPQDFIRFLGPVTPLGGLLLMLSWAIFIFRVMKKNTSPKQ